MNDLGLSPAFLQSLIDRVRPRLFLSYHHGNDWLYYKLFSEIFGSAYRCIQDHSVGELINSTDPDYVYRRISERYIVNTSCTVVLCGRETPWRKYVDWEIKATLDRKHGLVGVLLPTITQSPFTDQIIVPDRLLDNLHSGYASWIHWRDLLAGGPDRLQSLVLSASKQFNFMIDNSREMMARNRPSPWYVKAT